MGSPYFLEGPCPKCYDGLKEQLHPHSRGPILAAQANPSRQTDISVFPEFESDLSLSWLQDVLVLAMSVALEPEQPGMVSLVIADDATVQGLNAEFRGVDKVTDVLSFSADHPGHWQGDEEPPDDQFVRPGQEIEFPFPDWEEDAPPLGEVIISLPQAKRQAAEANTPLERELALLIVHGVLHLVGHEHMETEETAQMQSREQVALSQLFGAL